VRPCVAAAVAALRDCTVQSVSVDERGKLQWGNSKRKRGAAAAGARVAGGAGEEGEGGEGGDGVVEGAGAGAGAAVAAEGDGEGEGEGGGSGSTAAACAVEVLHAPFSLTTGLYKGQLIVDPDAEEEALMEAVVSVVLDESGKLAGVLKPGGTVEAGAYSRPLFSST